MAEVYPITVIGEGGQPLCVAVSLCNRSSRKNLKETNFLMRHFKQQQVCLVLSTLAHLPCDIW